MLQRFPPYQLDVTNQCLWRRNERISLAPKVFAVLEYLVRHAGRLVPQEEILEAVWPDTYVQPEVLRTYILEIRKVLDDPAKRPRYIETSPKRGYRFIARISPESRPLEGLAAAETAPNQLVGRGAALAELEGYLQSCRRGQRQLIFVTGEGGIGKTSLVDAFSQQETAHPETRIGRGQCVEGFAWKEAYYPALEAIGSIVRTADGDEVMRVLATQAPTWLAQFPAAVKAEETEGLRREILGATRERMIRELCDALETLTLERPLVLILEDLQWVDNATLDLLSAIARRRAPAKVMIVATYRPVEMILSHSPLKLLQQDLLVHRLCHEISLTRLSEADIEEYLTVEFPGSEISHKLAGPIHRHSDGNPLFMRAILDRVVKSGVIDDRDWTLTRPAEDLRLEIPETLQQMIETQLEQLGAAERQLLRAASVIGRRFTVRALGDLLGSDSEQVEEICENVAASQRFLKPATPSGANGQQVGEYEFKHMLYREVLYQQLKPTQRKQMHLRFGRHLEAQPGGADPALASELAFHFEEAKDSGKAIRYLIQSAASAMRRYAHGESIKMLNRASDLVRQGQLEDATDLELEILERISDSLYAQGEMPQSANIDYRAAELAAQHSLKAAQVHALTRVARALAFVDLARCITVCDRAADVSRTLDDPLLLARAELLATSWHIVANGWNASDAAVCAAARDKLRQLSQELAAYYEILYAHVQCIQGDYADAVRTALAGIAKALETDSLVVYLSAHSSLAHSLLHLGRWGELLAALASGREAAAKNKNTPWLGIFEAHLAWLHFHACDFDGASRLAGDLLRRHSDEPHGQIRTMAGITAAFAQVELGAADEAIAALSSIRDRPEQPRFFMDWYWRRMAHLGLARAWLAKQEREKAAHEAEVFLQWALTSADPSLVGLAWEMKSRVAAEAAVAQRCVEEGLAAMEAADIPLVAWRIHARAARVFGGDRRLSERHREQAKSFLRRLAESLAPETPLRLSLINASQAHPLLQPSGIRTRSL